VNARLESLVEYRLVTPEDIPFVMSSWIKSFRPSPWAGVFRNNRFTEETKGTILDLLERGAIIEVACSKNDPTNILGWACGERLRDGSVVCHYVYVKQAVRRMGLASELLEHIRGSQDRCYYTFRTYDSDHFPAWRHVPEIARRK
jgi:GNAT superfamily N-acetyltransferase